MEKRIIKLGASFNCTPHGNAYEDYCDTPEEKLEEIVAEEKNNITPEE